MGFGHFFDCMCTRPYVTDVTMNFKHLKGMYVYLEDICQSIIAQRELPDQNLFSKFLLANPIVVISVYLMLIRFFLQKPSTIPLQAL